MCGKFSVMEDWEFDFEWLRVRHIVKNAMNRDKMPDLQAIFFLIGLQELGRWDKNFTKEEKQDLMHIAVCELLSDEGYYEFKGRDADGWPHYEQVKNYNVEGVQTQDRLLKEKAIKYFKVLEKENGGFENLN